MDWLGGLYLSPAPPPSFTWPHLPALTTFRLSPLQDDTDLRLMPGDELRLKHRNASNRGPWEGVGNVIRFDQTEEVCLELRDNVSADKERYWNLRFRSGCAVGREEGRGPVIIVCEGGVRAAAG